MNTANVCCNRLCRWETNPFALGSYFRTSELPIRNSEACGFNSAYHVSWSLAFAELALRGLNGARSLWHDMSWAFACALCLVCAELLVLGVKSGWLLQVASYKTLIPLGLKGVCSKWLPENRVLISAMLDRVWVTARQALDVAASYPWLWAGSVRVKGRSAHFEWHSL